MSNNPMKTPVAKRRMRRMKTTVAHPPLQSFTRPMRKGDVNWRALCGQRPAFEQAAVMDKLARPLPVTLFTTQGQQPIYMHEVKQQDADFFQYAGACIGMEQLRTGQKVLYVRPVNTPEEQEIIYIAPAKETCVVSMNNLRKRYENKWINTEENNERE